MFLLSRRSVAAPGPIQRVKVVKRPGPEADHSLPSTAEVQVSRAEPQVAPRVSFCSAMTQLSLRYLEHTFSVPNTCLCGYWPASKHQSLTTDNFPLLSTVYNPDKAAAKQNLNFVASWLLFALKSIQKHQEGDAVSCEI